jgi:intracellular sulfur oxidation DsrE/DsrF family protein
MDQKLMTQISNLFMCLLLLAGMPSAITFGQGTAGPDKVVVQVNEDDPKGMNFALNNVQNLIAYYKEKGEKVQIEVVAFGPGLHMLRQDTSPVKDRVTAIAAANPEVQFSACSNTLANMTKQEGNKPPLVSEAKPVVSGVGRIVELQKQGYIYLRP